MLIEKEFVGKFNTKEIRRGTLIYAKHKTWDKGEMGFVTSAKEDEVIVQYPPAVGNVTNHFFLPVEEVVNGDWEIRYSNDMQTVIVYQEGDADES